MTGTRIPQLAAYGAAALFVLRLASFFVPSVRDATAISSPLLGGLNALLGIAPHLLIFPAVAALVAPEWARATGYGWLAVDIATDIMALDGVPPLTAFSLKYGGHLAAALWFAVSSWQMGGAVRVVGLLLAFDLASYSFISVRTPVIPLLPSILLLPLWSALVGRQLGAPVERQMT